MRSSVLTTFGTWIRNLDLNLGINLEKPGLILKAVPEPSNRWVQKDLEPGKHGINIGLKNMSE